MHPTARGPPDFHRLLGIIRDSELCRLFRARNKRHTAATHMLRSGVDLNTIRAWLGHASLDTTTVYAEIDLEIKAKAVAVFDSSEPTRDRSYRDDEGLMAFLRAL